METNAAETTICELIANIHIRLDQAAGIAKAASACAEAGQAAHAARILMEFEGLAHDAQDLFKAALTIKRHLLPDQT